MEDIYHYLENAKWDLYALEAYSFARFKKGKSKMEICVDIITESISIWSPAKEGDVLQYYYGFSPTVKELKLAIQLSESSYKKITRR